jgi:hypothetical protein
MRLRQLFEATADSIAFCFGRMNPPTIGHGQVFDTLAKTNKNYRIYVSPAQTPKKDNPLDFATKVKFIKSMFPQHAANVSDDAGLNTIMKIAVALYSEGYRNITVVAGSDRLESFSKLLNDYNGVESAHGTYKFDNIELVSSGDRDPDAEGLEGISASAAREAAREGDLEKFSQVTGAGNLADELYKAVRVGLKIKEDVDEGWKSKMAGAALAAANLLGSPAQAAEEPIKPITIAYVMIDGEVKKYDLGNKFNSAREAEEFISSVLDKKGLSGYTLDIKHGYPKKKDVKEAPIEMDPSEPMNPMIYGAGGNPAKLQYRMMRAANQLKDLAARAQGASAGEWQTISKHFDELSMNISQIKHGLEELAKQRRKGGVRSRGIDTMIDSITNIEESIKNIGSRYSQV